MHAARGEHVPQATEQEFWEGSETGMASGVIRVTPLSVQQDVPNMQVVAHAPQTQVIPELEQGEGRAPGWKWGWMRKNIPYAPDHISSHMQRNFGPLRIELPLGYESTKKLNRPSQTILEHFGKTPPVTLDQPVTVYNTVAAPSLSTWGEPV